ncbi:hypothetical protein [Spirosoma rhododendri]|uniref:Uncharacterized protein n=1 Tax=Spirosoma rhododendri TaxID=2728024 RepID=A0A7L5DQM0_9BACT|nr:hypothetical protein [Spirosoma rhododendri]QJD79523.1 hypothetical protein HH216_14725 [Spirosoma rhododendri]
MNQPISDVRTLANLTREEGQSLFSLGFGFTPPLDALTNSYQGGLASYRIISDSTFTMILYQGGGMSAFREHDDISSPVSVNIAKVVGYLNSLEIDFDRIPVPAQLSVTLPALSPIIGPVFTVRPQTAVVTESVGELLTVAGHWASGTMLKPPVTLEEFKDRLNREMNFMTADSYNLTGIEVQWMDEGCTVLAIATTVVPVMVLATITLTE